MKTNAYRKVIRSVNANGDQAKTYIYILEKQIEIHSFTLTSRDIKELEPFKFKVLRKFKNKHLVLKSIAFQHSTFFTILYSLITDANYQKMIEKLTETK